MAIIGLQKGSGKKSRVREKSVKSQGILIWIMSGTLNKVLQYSQLMNEKNANFDDKFPFQREQPFNLSSN